MLDHGTQALDDFERHEAPEMIAVEELATFTNMSTPAC